MLLSVTARRRSSELHDFADIVGMSRAGRECGERASRIGYNEQPKLKSLARWHRMPHPLKPNVLDERRMKGLRSVPGRAHDDDSRYLPVPSLVE